MTYETKNIMFHIMNVTVSSEDVWKTQSNMFKGRALYLSVIVKLLKLFQVNKMCIVDYSHHLCPKIPSHIAVYES